MKSPMTSSNLEWKPLTMADIERMFCILKPIPFLGFTVSSGMWIKLMNDARIKRLEEHREFNLGQMNPANMLGGVETYQVPNQPCDLVKWTNRKLMLSYVHRKDAEVIRFKEEYE